MINLNSLATKIEDTIFAQTGVKAKINGGINFSLLGKATIVAHDISIANGHIDSCEFTIPVFSIFDVKQANISGDIIVNKANIKIQKLSQFNIKNNIHIQDSVVNFLNKDYAIVTATVSNNDFYCITRTNQHKYEINMRNNDFVVINNNNKLKIIGHLSEDGSARGSLEIIAENINKWFEFDTPKITGKFPITTNFEWNGNYDIKFNNISTDNVKGNIYLNENGSRFIQLKSNKSNMDFSFLLQPTKFFINTTVDLDFSGNIKFANNTFNHIYVNAVGTDSELTINKIIADDTTIQQGHITKYGAENINITSKYNGKNISCLFSGTPNKWSCSDFAYDNKITGSVYYNDNHFDIILKSNTDIDNLQELLTDANSLIENANISFMFPNMAGTIKIINKKQQVSYEFIKNKNLTWAKTSLDFLPKFMYDEYGDFMWQGDEMYFIPYSKTWQLKTNGNYFNIVGNSFKEWLNNLNLQAIKDSAYTIYGNYKNKSLAGLTINVLNHTFKGSAVGNNIVLKTDILNIDSLIEQKYLDNYEELSFFYPAVITLPFAIDINLSLSANEMIYKNIKYNSFIYSLKENTQTFSIADSARGNLLATLKKDNANYFLDVQLNKFLINGFLLPTNTPLNISDSVITSEIHLQTNGKIAYDFWNNFYGTFDASFDGGTLQGLGIANFYANYQNIHTLNAEEYLSQAFSGGISPIKKLQITGDYNSGNIKTTTPFTLLLKHTDIVGTMEFYDKKMQTNLNILLRGTSTNPTPINLQINKNGSRDYSLSEIMTTFDAEYMKDFIRSHDRF
ncbi:MAG: hypothetical protein MJ158_01010 [Alphaproteobacteria bacterium]|nr:hypothetical protein [Alphaproteobacteria bacterium]